MKPFFKNDFGTLYNADSISLLNEMESGVSQCCVTSPPSYGERDFGIDGCIGSEGSVDDYLEKVVSVFKGIKKLLCDDGTLWVAVKDTVADGFAQGIPWLLASRLRKDGWILVQDIVWNKRVLEKNSAVSRRFTDSHDTLFLFAKTGKYFFNMGAMRTAAGKNSVWAISNRQDHRIPVQTLPPRLVSTCILIGTSDYGVCSKCGTFATRGNKCKCKGREVVPCVVIDPFAGFGTTLDVAQRLGRKYIGVEINGSFCSMASKKLACFGKAL